MILFLIGMPGCGKSTLGKKLSQKTRIEFCDLDDLIMQYSGQSIPDLINSGGEDYFRQVETTVLNQLDGSKSQVVATGGGTPCFNNNMTTMKQKGHTAFLDTSLVTLHSRLLDEGIEKRPLLPTDPSALLPFLEELYETRLPFYLQAEYRINPSDNPLNELEGILAR